MILVVARVGGHPASPLRAVSNSVGFTGRRLILSKLRPRLIFCLSGHGQCRVEFRMAVGALNLIKFPAGQPADEMRVESEATIVAKSRHAPNGFQ